MPLALLPQIVLPLPFAPVMEPTPVDGEAVALVEVLGSAEAMLERPTVAGRSALLVLPRAGIRQQTHKARSVTLPEPIVTRASRNIRDLAVRTITGFDAPTRGSWQSTHKARSIDPRPRERAGRWQHTLTARSVLATLVVRARRSGNSSAARSVPLVLLPSSGHWQHTLRARSISDFPPIRAIRTPHTWQARSIEPPLPSSGRWQHTLGARSTTFTLPPRVKALDAQALMLVHVVMWAQADVVRNNQPIVVISEGPKKRRGVDLMIPELARDLPSRQAQLGTVVPTTDGDLRVAGRATALRTRLVRMLSNLEGEYAHLADWGAAAKPKTLGRASERDHRALVARRRLLEDPEVLDARVTIRRLEGRDHAYVTEAFVQTTFGAMTVTAESGVS